MESSDDVHLPYHLCNYCSEIELLGDSVRAGEKSKYIYFNFTLRDIYQAAEENCNLCTYLLGVEGRSPGEQTIITISERFKKDRKSGPTSSPVLCALLRGLYNDTEVSISFGLFDNDLHRQIFQMLGELQVCTASPSIAEEIPVRPIIVKVASPHSFGLARTWLEECLADDKHKPSQETHGNFMPKRLIQLSRHEDGLKLQLRETKFIEEPEAYAALSYCWGSAAFLSAGAHSVQDMLCKIPWDHLPKTIQNAAIVTTELGIGFLWVDSLCILQDSPEEKAVEISLMPKIYMHATLTIVASRASNAYEGFLNDRAPTEFPEHVFKLPYRSLTGDAGSIIVFRVDEKYKFSSEPLDERGWALQERALSPRILDYGSLQTKWICHHNHDSDSKYWDGWGMISSVTNKKAQRLKFRGSGSKNSCDRKEDENSTLRSHIQKWNDIVTEYTGRSLSVNPDRILAISGLAEIFDSFLKGKYYAAIWRCSLPYELLWPVASPLPRPTVYQGPSWSWVSVLDGIMFIHSDQQLPRITDFKIISCETELENSEAIYGAVKRGHLKVWGAVVCAELFHCAKAYYRDSFTIAIDSDHGWVCR